ncbi:hypothetical protein [Bacillus marinisedimentorum]|uniref:hypothetical protein n=1 Tax=Bacillus marinisedimentorum TaxID=1821260 RepID=UPI0007E051D2|nr:hypothetical protein [Bacillus marinisedimentorum]
MKYPAAMYPVCPRPFPCRQTIYSPYPVFYGGVPARQQYPDVDPELFSESAQAFQVLMKDAGKILDKLAESKMFAHDVMAAAQEDKKQKVEQLIQSTGVMSKVVVTYNPDSIHLQFHSRVHGTECCALTMVLRWR